MDAQELQRIYVLKSSGLQELLADINAVTNAFNKSAQAKASLVGDKGMFDEGQLAVVNKQLEQMVEIQSELLDVVKKLNPELAKSAGALAGTAKATDAVAGSMDDLSNSAKSLGNNLTNATSGLAKVQSVLNSGNVNSYNTAILDLAASLEELYAQKQKLMSDFKGSVGSNDLIGFLSRNENEGITLQGDKMKMGIIEIPELTSEYLKLREATDLTSLSTETYLAELSKVNAQINEVKSSMTTLNKAFNPADVSGATAGTVLQAKGETKADQQLTRGRVEEIKNESIAVNENATAYQKLVAELALAKIQLKAMFGTAQQGTAVWDAQLAKVQKLDAEYKAFNKQMGNNQVEVGNYGLAIKGVGNVVTMFTRQLARGIGSLIIWGLLFDAISKAGEAIKESIPGTDEYIKKQEERAQAIETLTQSFKDLSDSIIKVSEDIVTLNTATDAGIDGAKRREAITKAQGVTSQQAYAAEIRQAEDHKKVLELEHEALQRKDLILNTISKTLQKGQRIAEEYIGRPEVIGSSVGGDPQKNKNVQYDLYNKLADAIQKANLPAEQQTKTMAELNKAYAAGGDLIKVYAKIVREAAVSLNQNQQALLNNTNAVKVLDTEIETKRNNLIYSKNVELNNQLIDLKESFRQLQEKRDVESVDKIVKDIEAKYTSTINKLKQTTVQYAKGITSVPEIYIPGTKDEDFVAMYNSLPKDVRAKADAIIAQQLLNKRAEDRNATEDFLVRSSNIALAHKTSELSGESDFAKHSADYGMINYGGMADAMDKEAAAKKQAIETQYETEKQAYVKNGDDITELQKLKDDKLVSLDEDMYVRRLALGMNYFKRITEQIESNSERVLSETRAYNQNRAADVLEGHRSKEFKDKATSKIDNQSIIAQAEEEIRAAQVELKNLEAAKIEAEGNSWAAEISKDPNKRKEAEKALNVVLDEQAKLEEKIANARRKKNEAKSNLTESYWRDIANGLLQVGQMLSDSYFGLLEKQDAYRNEMAHRALAWNEMVMQSEVQSSNERIAQQKASVQEEHQLQRDQAIRDRKRAQSQIIVNAVIASGKALATDAPNWIKFGIDEGVIVGETAVQEAFLARAPAYAQGIYGQDSHPGGNAWVGDGGEREVILSPSSPTLMNLPRGSQVIPMSHLAGNLGSSLKAPSFTSTSSASFGGGGGSVDVSAHENAIHHLYGLVGSMAKSLSNMQINYNANQAGTAALKASYKTKRI